MYKFKPYSFDVYNAGWLYCGIAAPILCLIIIIIRSSANNYVVWVSALYSAWNLNGDWWDNQIKSVDRYVTERYIMWHRIHVDCKVEWPSTIWMLHLFSIASWSVSVSTVKPCAHMWVHALALDMYPGAPRQTECHSVIIQILRCVSVAYIDQWYKPKRALPWILGWKKYLWCLQLLNLPLLSVFPSRFILYIHAGV